jgi:hypothetical protein
MNKGTSNLFIDDKIYIKHLRVDSPSDDYEKDMSKRNELTRQFQSGKSMKWTPINFKKHQDKTFPQVMFKDADWFFYAYDKNYFKNGLANQAHEIYLKARSIRVPEINDQEMMVKYEIYNNKFQTMYLIPYSPGLQDMDVSRFIDFYTPRKYASYDKLGYKNFVQALKEILFGDSHHYITKAICEEFFNNDSNFNLFHAINLQGAQNSPGASRV